MNQRTTVAPWRDAPEQRKPRRAAAVTARRAERARSASAAAEKADRPPAARGSSAGVHAMALIVGFILAVHFWGLFAPAPHKHSIPVPLERITGHPCGLVPVIAAAETQVVVNMHYYEVTCSDGVSMQWAQLQ